MIRKSTGERITPYVFSCLIAVTYLVPLWLLIVTSFRSTGAGIFRDWNPFSVKAFVPYEFSTEGVVQLFSGASKFPKALLNTFVVCGISIVVGIFVNGLAAFGLARFQFPGRNILFGITLFSYMVPFQSVVIPLATLSSRIGLVDSLFALILPSLANGFLIFLFRQFFLGIPNEFYEAGVVDGATIWQALVHIYVPLTKTVMITAGLVLFLAHWNSFFWPMVIIRSSTNWVIQLALAALQSETRLPNWGPVLSAALITIAVPVAIVVSLQRYFRVSLIEGGTKG